jgi:holo-[acyl-carrier protein] synthase
VTPPAPPIGASPAFAVGCDVVDVARLDTAFTRTPALLERVFTPRERRDVHRGGVAPGSATERRRLAARFAAKEAVRKATGDLRMGFHAVEVRSAPDGAPCLWVHGRPSPLALSLSHDAGVAMAVVVGARDAPTHDPASGSDPGRRPATSPAH